MKKERGKMTKEIKLPKLRGNFSAPLGSLR
jgi:hypothetical protein